MWCSTACPRRGRTTRPDTAATPRQQRPSIAKPRAEALRCAAATMPGEMSVTDPSRRTPACFRLSRKNPVPASISSAVTAQPSDRHRGTGRGRRRCSARVRSTTSRRMSTPPSRGRGRSPAGSPHACATRSGAFTARRTPPCRGVLDERGHADGAVLGGEQRRKLLSLDLQPGLQRRLEAAVDRLLGSPQCVRRSGDERRHERLRCGVHVVGSDHSVDEPDRQRLGSIDEPAGKDQVLRASGPDQP